MAGYTAETTLPYEPEQLFALAADVERYPEFLPGWVAARVRKLDDETYLTDQILRFGVFRERFSTKTVLHRPHRIDVSSTERPFRNFELTWTFEPTSDGRCRVTLTTRIAFRARLAEQVFGRALARLTDDIMTAFARRAHRLYTPASRAASRGAKT